ncbi:transcriptional regulator [Kordiimonas sediminis]|uniref:Transcriptional regulator n=1 Tax=Kordiimonas sediminis TaxID=1735581 RepID=A0A919B034_9PROT|nr:AraC family transcriptional regulator [Kordiimonas sediminis]GHF30986.1 transcriptional regulator [Kordiimonas sediminis]
MISLFTLQALLLALSILLILAQMKFIRSSKAHLLFAIFCASIAFLMVKQLSATIITPFHYLIGIGASATCNAFWLLSRVLFRRRNALEIQHIAVALAIALMVALNQGYHFLQGIEFISPSPDNFVSYMLGEFTLLLSSCILALTFWEGVRNFKKDTAEGKGQRIFFLLVFSSALIGSKIAEGLTASSPQTLEFCIAAIIVFVMINTQILLVWKYSANRFFSRFYPAANMPPTMPPNTLEQSEGPFVEVQSLSPLARQIHDLLIGESLFLQENLKVCDIAQKLGCSEHAISHAIRNDLGANNFNQFINQLRISYSQKLLADPNNKRKSILTISFDSGFASIGPFTRAFKALTGMTPSEYRNAQSGNNSGQNA